MKKEKAMSKLRLDYFLMRGGLLVDNDNCLDAQGIETLILLYDCNWNIEEDCNSKCFIKSFAPRKNNGSQPVPDDFPVIVTNSSSTTFDITAGSDEISWSSSLYVRIDTWKPDLEKLIEQQNEYDKAKEIKIQEFEHGQEVYFSGGRNSFKYKFGCLTLESGKCILLYDGGHVVARLDAVSSKSQEEIELEEAKKKQVDLVTNEVMTWSNLKYEDAHRVALKQQERGFLSEIILPLKEN